MRVLFGRIDYVFGQVDREHPAEKAINSRSSSLDATEAELDAFHAYHGGIQDAVSQKASDIDATEKLSIAAPPRHTVLDNPDGPGLMGGYLSKILTGKDAKAVLGKLGIRVSCRDSKAVNDEKILTGLAQMGPSEEAAWERLVDAVDGYVQLQTAAGAPINHVNVIV